MFVKVIAVVLVIMIIIKIIVFMVSVVVKTNVRFMALLRKVKIIKLFVIVLILTSLSIGLILVVLNIAPTLICVVTICFGQTVLALTPALPFFWLGLVVCAVDTGNGTRGSSGYRPFCRCGMAALPWCCSEGSRSGSIGTRGWTCADVLHLTSMETLKKIRQGEYGMLKRLLLTLKPKLWCWDGFTKNGLWWTIKIWFSSKWHQKLGTGDPEVCEASWGVEMVLLLYQSCEKKTWHKAVTYFGWLATFGWNQSHQIL